MYCVTPHRRVRRATTGGDIQAMHANSHIHPDGVAPILLHHTAICVEISSTVTPSRLTQCAELPQ